MGPASSGAGAGRRAGQPGTGAGLGDQDQAAAPGEALVGGGGFRQGVGGGDAGGQAARLGQARLGQGGGGRHQGGPGPDVDGGNGDVARSVTLQVPVRVDYDLTPLGAGLQVAVSAVKVWAEIHMEEIEAARSAYDGAALK
jgi:HxlR-like helix-turn-helix